MMTTIFSILLSISLACQPTLIDSGNNSELIQHLVLTGMLGPGRIEPYKPAVIFSIKLNDIKRGDIIHLTSYGELTNDLGFNVMLGFNTILSASKLSITAIDEITEGKGYNITPAMHHGNFTDVGNYEFKSDYKEIYINTILWGASTKVRTGDKLKVEQDYGRLSVLLWRK